MYMSSPETRTPPHSRETPDKRGARIGRRQPQRPPDDPEGAFALPEVDTEPRLAGETLAAMAAEPIDPPKAWDDDNGTPTKIIPQTYEAQQAALEKRARFDRLPRTKLETVLAPHKEPSPDNLSKNDKDDVFLNVSETLPSNPTEQPPQPPDLDDVSDALEPADLSPADEEAWFTNHPQAPSSPKKQRGKQESPFLTQSPPTSPWRRRLTYVFGILAGLFLKTGDEKMGEDPVHVAERANHAMHDNAEEKISSLPPAQFDKKTIQASAPQETLPSFTYTLKSGDTLWGIADRLVEEAGEADPDGTLTLKTVKTLREANEITGDAAHARKMWAGKTINLSSAYHLLHPQQEIPVSPVATPPPSKERVPTLSLTQTPSSSNPIESSLALPESSPEVLAAFPPELLSPTFATRGETPWSRVTQMLESLNVKPNTAKRGVLCAIVLTDSHKTELEAMRVKYRGHKKFNSAKDTLDFTRAAQAALDLKAGMSPSEVAKKYGVKDEYEILRSR